MNDETEMPPAGPEAPRGGSGAGGTGATPSGGTTPEVTEPEVTQPEVTQPEATSPGPLVVETPATDEYAAMGAEEPAEGAPGSSGPAASGPAGPRDPAPGWSQPPWSPPGGEPPPATPAGGAGGAGWTVPGPEPAGPPPATGQAGAGSATGRGGAGSAVGTDGDGGAAPPPDRYWPVPTPPARRDASRGPWQFLLGVLIGAVVAALVAGGIVAATDDGSNPRPSTPLARNTSVFAEPRDVQGVLQKVEPAVVVVRTGGATDDFARGESRGGEGTGFVISSDGFIVTNNHVVDGAGGRIQVTFLDGTEKPARVVGRSTGNDLAVLKVDAHDLPTAELGDSNTLQVGDQVLAIGNALALEGGPSVTQGIVSAKGRQITTENGETLFNLLQTDAAINRGNSGGPLVNSRGQVVGINTAIAPPDQAQNVGFAIPISQARPIVDELRQGRNVRTAFLGVETQTLTRPIANELGIDFTAGAVVRRVSADSPARSAGIEARDVIVKVGDVDVESADDVAAGVRTHRPGDKVAVAVVRDGKKRTFTATLAERPEEG